MKWKFSIMLIILVLFSLSAVCAADADNSTVNNHDDGTLSADYQDSVISDDEKPDIPDLVVDDKKHVYQSNINLYQIMDLLLRTSKGWGEYRSYGNQCLLWQESNNNKKG